MTIVLSPDINAGEILRLNAFSAQAVRATVEFYIQDKAPGVAIKWPNDIICEHGKVAGILIQNTLRGDTITNSVIGIGLNVNEVAFPAGIPDPASLKGITGRSIPVEEVYSKLIGELNVWYEQTLGSTLEDVRSAYNAHLYGRGMRCEFIRRANNSTFQALLGGVDNTGRLVLQSESGSEAFAHGEVQFIARVNGIR